MENKQLFTTDGQKIDVHCHLFNKKIASIPLLLDTIRSILKMKRLTDKNELESDSLSALNDIRRISRLLKMLFSNDEDALLNYLSKYESDTIFVPLMFDLKFAVDSAEAKEALREMKAELQNELTNVYNGEENRDLSEDEYNADEFDTLLNAIDEIIRENDRSSENLLAGSQDDTFDEQYKQLIDLRNRHTSVIKPFFAVDSRRSDIFGKMKYALEKDNFAGVKMYCPNGYSPLDPRLDDVYLYCLDHHIPITAHCSYGGFATLENKVDVQGAIYKDNQVIPHNGELKFTKKIIQSGGVEERALALNHPDLWNAVLNKYKGLKLNLAHMGIRGVDDFDERYEWSNLIIKMMLEHENLYTDLSCMSVKESIAYLWDSGTKADPECDFNLKITDRIMFGTDFWLSMLFKDLKLYMKDFEDVFANKPEDFIRLQQINPKRFLKLKI
jgi:predicted TIM-barrel fold metal-dependent hydrolase